MTKARRDKRKAAERERGGHSVADHRPMLEDPEHPGHYLPVQCYGCRPPKGSLPLPDLRDKAMTKIKAAAGPRDWKPASS